MSHERTLFSFRRVSCLCLAACGLAPAAWAQTYVTFSVSGSHFSTWPTSINLNGAITGYSPRRLLSAISSIITSRLYVSRRYEAQPTLSPRRRLQQPLPAVTHSGRLSHFQAGVESPESEIICQVKESHLSTDSLHVSVWASAWRLQ